MSDKSSKEWNQAVFRNIAALYGAKNANHLARILKERFNVGRQTVYDWEKGRSRPTNALILKMSKDQGKPVNLILDTEIGEERSEPGSIMDEIYQNYKTLDDKTREILQPTLEMVNREVKFRQRLRDRDARPMLVAASKGGRGKPRTIDEEEAGRKDEERGISAVEEFEEEERRNDQS